MNIDLDMGRETVDPVWKRILEAETLLHFLLRCRLYSTIRAELNNDIYTAASSLKNYSDEKLLKTGQKKFSMKNLFGKSDEIRSLLWIWSHLLKKFLMENFILSPVKRSLVWIRIF